LARAHVLQGLPRLFKSGELAILPDAAPTIAQIVPQLEAGGAEVTTLEVTEAIVKAGARALVLSEGGRLLPRLVAVGGEFMAFPAGSKNPARILGNGARLKGLFAREHVRLVHARSRAPAWSALWAARSLGLPLVTTYHGVYREGSALKRLYNGVMARGDIVIANSRFTARAIKERYGKPDSGIATIYRGVDLARFRPEAVSAARIAALRASWGVGPTERLILHAARLSPLKGQGVVIEAARLLAGAADPDCIFILAGGAGARTAYQAALQQQIDAAALAGRVRLVGHLDDMAAGLATASLALMVSVEPEGFGRVAVEAQAMGCPVIASRIGALPEAVLAPPEVADAALTGWLVPAGDAAALAAAIAHALALPPEQHAAIGARARAFVAANYSVVRLQRSTLAVYDRLLGTRLERNFARSVEA
jgi:glycosyltransferase involved in cell wall biosynthesis